MIEVRHDCTAIVASEESKPTTLEQTGRQLTDEGQLSLEYTCQECGLMTHILIDVATIG